MAFPGTLNINYYKGDTYEFNIYPKKSTDGSAFDLTSFMGPDLDSGTSGTQTAIFKFSVIHICVPIVTDWKKSLFPISSL